MLLSMTGYGLAQRKTADSLVSIELRSLNAKTLDVGLRLPRPLQAHENEIRHLIGQALLRGKITLNLDLMRAPGAVAPPTAFHVEALRGAYAQLRTVAQELGLPTSEATLLAALRLPGVVPTPHEQAQLQAESQPADELSWTELEPLLREALDALQQFRRDEGLALQREILGYVATIRQLLTAIEAHDPQRLAQVRQRLRAHVAELGSPEQFNAARFEQEILYYADKLDISEEKTRLAAHLRYFEQAIQQSEEAVGKKLGFLAQEMGREINTIGSKANDATIQHLVVSMKEELEKIKEQLNNIL